MRAIITGSIARSANLRYISYSEGDFEFSRPAGTTHCTNGVKLGTKEWKAHSSMPNFAPIGATITV